MRFLILLLGAFSIHAFADENVRYPRVMACQNSSSNIYLEIFHDQAGFMGAPKDANGYLVVWSTVMGKDTQKRLILDVEMKHTAAGSGCTLDISWSHKASNGADAISHFNAKIAACNLLEKAPKGKFIQEDIYKSGKSVITTADLDCQLQ